MDFVPPSLPEQIAPWKLDDNFGDRSRSLRRRRDHLVAASHRFMASVIFVYGDGRDVFIPVVRGICGFSLGALAMREITSGSLQLWIIPRPTFTASLVSTIFIE